MARSCLSNVIMVQGEVTLVSKISCLVYVFSGLHCIMYQNKICKYVLRINTEMTSFSGCLTGSIVCDSSIKFCSSLKLNNVDMEINDTQWSALSGP